MAVLSDQFGQRYDQSVFCAGPREGRSLTQEAQEQTNGAVEEVQEPRLVSFRSSALFGNAFRPRAVLGC